MHPKTQETVSLARKPLARATSLVAERVAQVGWKIDNGGRWPAPPSLRKTPLRRSTAVLLSTLKLASTSGSYDKVETHGVYQLIKAENKEAR